MQLSKARSIVISFVIFVLSFLFLIMTLFSSIAPVGQNLRFSIFGFYNGFQVVQAGPANAWVLGAVVIFLLAMIDMGAYLLKQSAIMKNENVQVYKKISFWSVLSALLLLRDTAQGFIISLAGTALVLAELSIGVSVFFLNKITPNPMLLVIVLGFIVYAPLRIIVLKLVNGLSAAGSKYQPSYTLQPDGVAISLNFMGMKGDQGKFVVKFSELEEVRSLSFQEAETYYQGLGPNVREAFNQMKSMYKIGKERPKVLLMHQSGGRNVLLKGPEIHYLLCFSNPAVDDLLSAFKAVKR